MKRHIQYFSASYRIQI